MDNANTRTVDDLWKEFLLQIPLSLINKRTQAAGIRVDGFRPGNIPEKLKRNAIMSIVSDDKQLEKLKRELGRSWEADQMSDTAVHVEALTDGEVMVLCSDPQLKYQILLSLLLQPPCRVSLIQAILDKPSALADEEGLAKDNMEAAPAEAVAPDCRALAAENLRLKKELKKATEKLRENEAHGSKKLSEAEAKCHRAEMNLAGEKRRSQQLLDQIAALKEDLQAAQEEANAGAAQHKKELAAQERAIALTKKERIVIIGESSPAITQLLQEQSKYNIEFIDAASSELYYDKAYLENRRRVYVVKYTMRQSELKLLEEQQIDSIELADLISLKRLLR